MTSRACRPSLGNPWVLLATWFGSGYLPKAPGTWGSLAALPFAWLILDRFGALALAIASVVVLALGIVAAERFMSLVDDDDPGAVVIDEVAGQWLALIVVPLDPVWFFFGFCAFRLFDVLKPWPVGALDRGCKGGLGVMIDDIAAGLYALGVLWVMQRLTDGGLG